MGNKAFPAFGSIIPLFQYSNRYLRWLLQETGNTPLLLLVATRAWKKILLN
jgi:hypothetical protein